MCCKLAIIMDETKADDLGLALSVAQLTYFAKDERPPPAPPIVDWPAFRDLVPLSLTEREQLHALRDLVAGYVKEPENGRPLCVAVFGPPGSGKSFAVKQIAKLVESDLGTRLTTRTINLTQVSDAGELASTIAAALLSTRSHEVPLLFFDEFDAPRAGATYGWLSWFLAPMHDGEFLHGARSIPVTRAIFVFAGGTAASMKEFSDRRDDRVFREAKGPDFVSRLRGYLDVAGPNAEPRMLRRAYVLRAELQKRARRLGNQKALTVDPDVLTALLHTGRYRHGARSLATLIELCNPSEVAIGTHVLDWDALPKDLILDLLVDRGPLDPRAIHGAIALSGFGTTTAVDECWAAVASALWNEGATLAYAGQWQGHNRSLTERLAEELAARPRELRRTGDARPDAPPWFRSYLQGFDYARSRQEAQQMISADDWSALGIALEEPQTLADDERAWGEHEWKARVVERFRRRLAVSEASVARFVVGGNLEPTGGLPSGIIEEAVLTLGLGRPIYVAGGFGGAAADLGVVLGLSALRTGAVPTSLAFQPSRTNEATLQEIAPRLRPPPLLDLPVLPQERVQFLQRHSLGGPGWPPNGLTTEENREQFASDDARCVARLVVTGLLRLFDKR